MQHTRNTKEKSKKHVLVLDENFTFRYFLTKGLLAHGYECVEAWDYKWAESYLHKNIFDIVLADFRTFMNSGSDFCSTDSQTQNETPTIFLIGQATEEAMETAKRLGAKALFEKRGDLNELLEQINRILSAEMARTKS